MINIINNISLDSTAPFILALSGSLLIISKICVGFCYGFFGYIMLQNKGYNLNLFNKLDINDLIFIFLSLYGILCFIL
jgi:hypothetical protein